MKIILNPQLHPTSDEDRAEKIAAGGFGKYYTDNMIVAKYHDDTGWGDPELKPYGPITMDPATSVLHYGQEIFEGLKAYAQPDGGVSLFRPEANAARFRKSAARLALPLIDIEDFVAMVSALVRQEHKWVPKNIGESLYIRPFMFASEVGLGVRPSNEATFMIITTPASAYFDPSKPVTVWISTDYIRAAPGGTGDTKFGGNYAGTLLAQKQAAAEGCDQVVWLDAIERRWVEEMGGMNLYFVKGSGKNATLLTPKLTGTLLAGVTRDSIATVAADLGYPVEEGMISTDEWRDGVASGEITETFACGTAAVISPIGSAKSAQGTWVTGDGNPGPITMAIRETLLGIQHGTIEDKHGWNQRVL